MMGRVVCNADHDSVLVLLKAQYPLAPMDSMSWHAREQDVVESWSSDQDAVVAISLLVVAGIHSSDLGKVVADIVNLLAGQRHVLNILQHPKKPKATKVWEIHFCGVSMCAVVLWF